MTASQPGDKSRSSETSPVRPDTQHLKLNLETQKADSSVWKVEEDMVKRAEGLARTIRELEERISANDELEARRLAASRIPEAPTEEERK